MSPSKSTLTLAVCCVLCFFLLSPDFSNAADVKPVLRAWGIPAQADPTEADSYVRTDTADVAITYGSSHPGSEGYLMTMYLKNPMAIAGFDFEIIFAPLDLADFSTVQVYVDSLDTCPDPEETCWYFYAVRECLIQLGPWIGNWTVFEAHGAAGDSTSSACDTIWMLGIALAGTPIPPQPGYVPLLQFGVDAACVSDTLDERTVTFDFTGHLSTPLGELVPFRIQPGKLDLLPSIPGDANADGLVDLGDIIFLVNYLYKSGLEPCVMEAADPNSDCQVDLGDVVYLLNFLFKGGPAPQSGCTH